MCPHSESPTYDYGGHCCVNVTFASLASQVPFQTTKAWVSILPDCFLDLTRPKVQRNAEPSGRNEGTPFRNGPFPRVAGRL